MSASVPPAPAAGEAGQEKRIQVALMEERGVRRFKLTFLGETLALEHSGSLNRWAATGIVGRHNILLAHDGVMIDGRTIRFEDPNAIAELERLFNERYVAPPPAIKANKPAAFVSQTTAASQNDLAKIARSVNVTRDGFEFHINYLTKFGERKSEQLEKALESFQNMHLFTPHVNLQKAGIRIVVTTWDGEHFLEQPGIENLEHTTPEEVEAVIKRNMPGISAGASATSPPQVRPIQRRVTRLDLRRRPHDARFHPVWHRTDGTTEEGPLLIRANLPKLQTEELFGPEITIIMTAMNDRLILERTEEVEGKLVKRSEAFDLKTDEDAKKVEAALNACLAMNPKSSDNAQTAKSVVSTVEPPPPSCALGYVPAPASGLGLRA